MIKFTAGVIVTLLLIALIGGGYFWINKPAITKPIPVVSQAPSPTIVMAEDKTASASSDSYEKPVIGFVNPGSTMEAIQTALRNKLYGNLASYMAASISVTMNGITKTVDKTTATQQLTMLDAAQQPWDFSSTNPVATQLITTDPQRFKDTYIGTAKNYYAAAFAFNDVYLIKRIYVTKNYRPLITK